MTIRVNGVVVGTGTWPNAEVAAVRELLRQRAVACALLPDGEIDEAAIGTAVERLLEQEVRTPSPDEAECRRYYDSHRDAFRSGDLVLARHILFQIIPGAPLAPIRSEAEETLATLVADPDQFDAVARTLSNCPSGAEGGNLGQIGRGDTVPEFERELFAPGPAGILRRLVRTRYGFHIVAIDRRIPGAQIPFEAARPRIVQHLQQAVQEKALRQYVAILAGKAEITGVDLGAAVTPLVQ